MRTTRIHLSYVDLEGPSRRPQDTVLDAGPDVAVSFTASPSGEGGLLRLNGPRVNLLYEQCLGFHLEHVDIPEVTIG